MPTTPVHSPGHSSGTSLRPQIVALLGERRAPLLALIVTSLLSGITESAVLTIVAQAAADLVSGQHRVQADLVWWHIHATVGGVLLAALVLAALRLALQVPVSLLPARIAANVQVRLRQGLFTAFTAASWTAQARDREGHLQELLTNQVIQASQGALQATTFVTATVTLAILVLSALILNTLMAAVVFAAAVLLFLLLRPLSKFGGQQAIALSQAQLNYASSVGEATRVAEDTQVYGVASSYSSLVAQFVDAAQHLYFRTQMLGRFIPNVYQSCIYVIVVVGLIALNATGSGRIPSLGAVVLLLVRAGTYGQQAQGAYQFTRQSLPYVTRLKQAEARYLDSTPATGRRHLHKVETLAFDDVSFRYTPGDAVLANISFDIGGGEAIGIVGPSGAGKSTLVQILLQLRFAGDGRYLVNGTSAREFARLDWHRAVAYVPQESRLLHASVAANIRYFRSLPDAAVERAAKLARIHDDVIGWANGYESIIGPRADAVSGGQQQRICIARALAARPEVVILDEPTSALDPQSENLLQQSLVSLKGDVTLIIVAHRMSTLDLCDRVMVIEDGRLGAFGSVATLRRTSGYFRSASDMAARVAEHRSS